MTHFQVFGERPVLYQWDTGRRVIVLCDCQEVHFSNALDGEALVVATYEEDGTRYANIPNILLQSALPLNVYAYVCAGERYTQRATVLEVNPRSKPADYVYTETEVKNYDALVKLITALGERLTDLESGGIPGSADKFVISYRVESLMGTHKLILIYNDGGELAISLPQMGIDIDRVVKIGTTDPTEFTTGKGQQLYINKNNGKIWVRLTDIPFPADWIPVASGEEFKLPGWVGDTKPKYTAEEVGAPSTEEFEELEDTVSGKLSANELPGAVATALETAKKSGEFDGKDYVLTAADKAEIAEQAAGLVDTALLAIIGEVSV